MATTTTKNGSVCSRLLRTIVCALVMLCLLIAAVPTPTRPDYDGAYPRYSTQEIRRTIEWYAKKYRLDPACCARSSRPNQTFASMPCLPRVRSA